METGYDLAYILNTFELFLLAINDIFRSILPKKLKLNFPKCGLQNQRWYSN